MIIFLVSIFASLFLAIFSTSLAQILPFSGIGPDLLLIAILMVARSQPPSTSILAGFLGGLALDGLSMLPLGFYALFYTLIAFLISLNRDKVRASSRLTSFFLFIAAVVVKILYIFLVLASLRLFQVADYRLPPTIFLEAVLSMGVCMVFLFLSYLFNRKKELL